MNCDKQATQIVLYIAGINDAKELSKCYHRTDCKEQSEQDYSTPTWSAETLQLFVRYSVYPNLSIIAYYYNTI